MTVVVPDVTLTSMGRSVVVLPAACRAAADARAYPAPGELIDVGGHRLHLYCVGTGSPTVVIDAGWVTKEVVCQGVGAGTVPACD